jgi:hypothetical protein
MNFAKITTATIFAASIFAVATAQTPSPRDLPPGYVADAQSTYNAREVAAGRQAYRAACQGHQSPEFCECLAAGVAQAMSPALVRQASRGIGDRLADLGSPASQPIYQADARLGAEDPEGRIAAVEGHYASGACLQFRR